MGSLAQFPVFWTPEDDFKLKNAVEGGASLESLAKGAVQFSRRFSLKEVKERWVSILYDPVVSAEVSARLVEVEHYSSNHSQKPFKPGGLKDSQGKTKTLSIRDHYYAVRKRIKNENLRSMEMELAGRNDLALDDNCGIDSHFNTMLGDPTLSHFEHQQAGLVDQRFPPVKIDGVATSCAEVTAQPFNTLDEQFNHESSLAEQGSLGKENPQIFENASLPVDCLQMEKVGIAEDANICDANDMTVDQHLVTGAETLFDGFDDFLPGSGVSLDSLDFPSPLPETSWWDSNLDIPDSMISVNDISVSQSHNAGDILALQGDVQAMDVFMPENDAGLANSLNHGNGPTNSGSEEYLAEIFDLLDDEIPVLDSDNKPTNDNPLFEGFRSLVFTSPMGAEVDRKIVSATKHSDLPPMTCKNINAVVSRVSGASHAVESEAFPLSDFQNQAACIINTEDPLVPNNDDISLPHITPSVKDLLERRNHFEAASNLCVRDHGNLGKREVCSKAQTAQHEAEKTLNNVTDVGTHTSLRGTSLLHAFPKREPSELVISRGSDLCLSNAACPLETTGQCNKSDYLLSETPDHQAYNQGIDHDDPSMREPLSRCEHQEYQSDDEIPYYSDVEEMVLDMDLDPVEQDIKLKEKVLKYQSSGSRRTIIRLEQAAHSFMQRAIRRRGALAVIYGRNSKHYIKKSEALLGRATDDSKVDIDLGSEGRAHNISRRQAVIKLEADGNFYIKNIGKRSIYKNNVEVATGKTTKLQSGSLIEIQRLAFIFEENPTCVRRHLRNLKKPAKPINACQKPLE